MFSAIKRRLFKSAVVDEFQQDAQLELESYRGANRPGYAR